MTPVNPLTAPVERVADYLAGDHFDHDKAGQFPLVCSVIEELRGEIARLHELIQDAWVDGAASGWNAALVSAKPVPVIPDNMVVRCLAEFFVEQHRASGGLAAFAAANEAGMRAALELAFRLAKGQRDP